MTDQPLPAAQLPPGDIYFDGERTFVGGVLLEPGRYRIAATDSVLEVAPPSSDSVDELDED